MKKTFLAALLLLLHGAVNAQGKYQVMAVAFYNCENFFNPANDPNKDDEEFTPTGANHYTYQVYHQKLHNIATVISKLGTDVTPDGPAIMGLSEIEDDQVLKDLVNQPEIKARGYKYIWFYGPDERGITTAMLYNPRYFRVLHAASVPVPLQGRPTRDVLYVRGILAGDTVNVMVNHWPSRYGGEAATKPLRAIAAGVDKRIADSLLAINPKSKILIMGDLNDDPVSPSVEKVLGVKAEAKQVNFTDIYNPWIKFYQKGLGTLVYHDSWNLFDQIMLSGDFLKGPLTDWHFYKADIFNRDFLIQHTGQYKGYPHRSYQNGVWANGYSDHFPVLVYLVRNTN